MRIMRRSFVFISSVAALTAAISSFAGCSSDASPAAEQSNSDSGVIVTPDSSVIRDTGTDAAPTVTALAHYDMSKGELPEGLWRLSSDKLITAWAATATAVTLDDKGAATTFSTLSPTPKSTYTLGVITNAAGDVFVAVAAAAAPPNDPAPGIYRIPAVGGAATPFSLGSATTPPMNFANGLDFIGNDLFVADSEGVIYKIGTDGVASAWSKDPLLAPDATACGGKVPLPIGANGIAHDANAIYVTNTNHGRLVKIPIGSDGAAGTASVIKEDCITMVGADGLLVDPIDHSFLVALNALDEIVRIAPDGSSLSIVASGAPLANPASMVLDQAGSQRNLFVSSPAFFKNADSGAANLSVIALP
jgi:sugar lactone lactonase YvrE